MSDVSFLCCFLIFFFNQCFGQLNVFDLVDIKVDKVVIAIALPAFIPYLFNS